jgi:hypothetical protein
VTQFGSGVDMISRIREHAAEVAKQDLDRQYAEAFRRIKLHIPPEAKEEVPTEIK